MKLKIDVEEGGNSQSVAKRLENFVKSFGGLSLAAAKASQELGLTSDQFERLAKASGISDDKLSAIIKRLKAIRSESRGGAIKQLAKEFGESEKSISALNDELKKVDQEIEKAANAARDSANGFTILKGAIANLISSGLQLLIEKSIEAAIAVVRVGGSFQTANQVIAQAVGSGTAAAGFFQEIQEFAATTPYELQQVQGAFIKLINRGIVPTEERLKSLGDFAISQGKSLDQYVEAILDAQQGNFERLKELGIEASKNVDGVTIAFKDFRAEGLQGPQEIAEAFFRLGEEAQGVKGSLESLGGTIEQRFSNISDSLAQIANDIFQGLIPGLEAFTDILIGADTSEFAEQLGEEIGAVLVALSELSQTLAETIGPGTADLIINVARAFGVVTQAINQLVTDAGPGLQRTIDQLNKFAEGFERTYVEASKITGAYQEFEDQAKQALSTSSDLLRSLTLQVSALDQVGEEGGRTYENVNDLINQEIAALKEARSNVASYSGEYNQLSVQISRYEQLQKTLQKSSKEVTEAQLLATEATRASEAASNDESAAKERQAAAVKKLATDLKALTTDLQSQSFDFGLEVEDLERSKSLLQDQAQLQKIRTDANIKNLEVLRDIAKANGDDAAAAELQTQVIEAQKTAILEQRDVQLDQLRLDQEIAIAKGEQAKLQVQIKLAQAETAIATAQAKGATDGEIAALQRILDLRQRELDAITATNQLISGAFNRQTQRLTLEADVELQDISNQQALERAQKAAQEREAKAQEQRQQAEERFNKRQQAEQARFEQQQQTAEERFNKRQQTEQAAFDKSQEQRRETFDTQEDSEREALEYDQRRNELLLEYNKARQAGDEDAIAALKKQAEELQTQYDIERQILAGGGQGLPDDLKILLEPSPFEQEQLRKEEELEQRREAFEQQLLTEKEAFETNQEQRADAFRKTQEAAAIAFEGQLEQQRAAAAQRYGEITAQAINQNVQPIQVQAVQGRYHGGRVNAGGIYGVGESMPGGKAEVFIPDQSGYVVNHHNWTRFAQNNASLITEIRQLQTQLAKLNQNVKSRPLGKVNPVLNLYGDRNLQQGLSTVGDLVRAIVRSQF